jgi:hypothetical protein
MALTAQQFNTAYWLIRNDEVGLVTHMTETGEPIIMADGENLFILNKETSEFEPYVPEVV